MFFDVLDWAVLYICRFYKNDEAKRKVLFYFLFHAIYFWAVFK